jgi:hypothetical protein
MDTMIATPPEVGQRVRVPKVSTDITATVRKVHPMGDGRYLVELRFDRTVEGKNKHGKPQFIQTLDRYWSECELAP